MELIQYWRTIRRFAWVIVLFTVIAGVTAALVTQELPRQYETTTVALVNPAQVILPGANGQDVVPIDQLVETYVELMNTAPVRNRLVAAGIPRSANDLLGEISVKQGGNTTLIDITIRDRDPNVAFQTAQQVIPAFNASLDELQSKVNVGDNRPRLEALVPWEVPETAPVTPVSPKPFLNISFAVAAGLLSGLALAFLLEYLDNTIKRDYDVRLRLNLTLLGLVVYRGGRRRGPGGDPVALVTQRHAMEPMAEAYRAIRTNVNFSVQDRSLKNLVVTSSVPGEGKTSTATNLAVVMAQSGKRVILVDADFRRPNMHKLFNKEENIGLGNLILGDRPENELILETPIPNLQVVCSGPNPPNPSELLGSVAMKKVMDRLAELADVVIYDTPPVGAVTDATVLAGNSDGVVLVVERGKTSVTAILRSKETLEAVRAPILGVVLNKVRGGEARSYYYYYYQYQTPPPPAGRNGQKAAANGKGRAKVPQGVATAVVARGAAPRPTPATGSAAPAGSPQVSPSGLAETSDGPPPSVNGGSAGPGPRPAVDSPDRLRPHTSWTPIRPERDIAPASPAPGWGPAPTSPGPAVTPADEATAAVPAPPDLPADATVARPELPADAATTKPEPPAAVTTPIPPVETGVAPPVFPAPNDPDPAPPQAAGPPPAEPPEVVVPPPPVLPDQRGIPGLDDRWGSRKE